MIGQSTALDDYVAEAEDNYSFQVVSTEFDLSTFTTEYILDMTSQAWRDPSEVDHVLWKHWVRVIIPSPFLGPLEDTALLFINGGSLDDPEPEAYPELRLISAGTKSVIVELTGVPNQPLQFAGEDFGRIEDEIISYSWDKYLDGGDDYWPVQLPMVKSVVRCMDAVQELVKEETLNNNEVTSFMITGGSKRGWTAWLTAAVDSRVSAVAPIVIDLLNMKRSFPHHWAAYGEWADALGTYEEERIFDRFDIPEISDLMEIVDPYSYLDRLTMPKFIINASGDDFFVTDSLQFYIDDLIGETHVRCMPNSDHYLSGGVFEEVLYGAVPYYYDFLNDTGRPEYSWTILPDGSIRVQTPDSPKEVKLWQASNPDARDFRLITIGASWTSSAITEQSEGIYIGEVPTPVEGWTAFFVEVIYGSAFSDQFSPSEGTYDYHFTTEIHVLPQERPFETDFSRDRTTDLEDLVMFTEHWLSDNAYRDIMPRRMGNGRIDLADFAVFCQNWLESR